MLNVGDGLPVPFCRGDPGGHPRKANGDKMRTILLSIKPEYVEKIFNGTKKDEYRKTKCKEKVDKIIIYSTAPVMQVVGEAEVEEIIEDSPEKVWEQTKDYSGTTYEFFCEYYKGKDKAVAYKLKNVKKYEQTKSLKSFGIEVAPQAFVYVNGKMR